MPSPAALLLPAPVVVTGHLVTSAPQEGIAKGVLYIDDTGLLKAVAAR